MFWLLAPRAKKQLKEKGWLDLDGVFEIIELKRYEEKGRKAMGLGQVGPEFDPWERYRYPALGVSLRRLAEQMFRAGCEPGVAKEACRRYEQAWFKRL